MAHRARRLAITGVVIVLSACVALLVTGSSWLATPVVPGAPAGTFIAWLALILLPLLVLLVFDRSRERTPTRVERGFRAAVRAALVLAAVWGPMSWLLAGNLRFEFIDAPRRLFTWVAFTVAVPVATIGAAVGWFLVLAAQRGRDDVNRSPDGT